MRYYRINVLMVLFVVPNVPFARIVIDLKGIQMVIAPGGGDCYRAVIKAQIFSEFQQY